MTASELLALLGRAWSNLLLYPGGLAAFVVLVVYDLVAAKGGPVSSSRLLAPRSARDLAALVPPWLGLALLPLPGAAHFDWPVDLVVLLVLLEWPLLLTIRTECRSTCMAARQRGARRLAAALNGYPALLLALLLTAGGSLQAQALAGPPDVATQPVAAALHWIGAVTLALALPALLWLGPFAAGDRLARIHARSWTGERAGLRLRGIGLGLLAALPWIGLCGERFWLMPLPPLVLALLLWTYDRWAGGAARRWAYGYLGLGTLQLLVLLVAALLALRERLT